VSPRWREPLYLPDRGGSPRGRVQQIAEQSAEKALDRVRHERNMLLSHKPLNRSLKSNSANSRAGGPHEAMPRADRATQEAEDSAGHPAGPKRIQGAQPRHMWR